MISKYLENIIEFSRQTDYNSFYIQERVIKMEEHQEQCSICGQEVQVENMNDVLCPDCLDTWQREVDSTW